MADHRRKMTCRRGELVDDKGHRFILPFGFCGRVYEAARDAVWPRWPTYGLTALHYSSMIACAVLWRVYSPEVGGGVSLVWLVALVGLVIAIDRHIRYTVGARPLPWRQSIQLMACCFSTAQLLFCLLGLGSAAAFFLLDTGGISAEFFSKPVFALIAIIPSWLVYAVLLLTKLAD